MWAPGRAASRGLGERLSWVGVRGSSRDRFSERLCIERYVCAYNDENVPLDCHHVASAFGRDRFARRGDRSCAIAGLTHPYKPAVRRRDEAPTAHSAHAQLARAGPLLLLDHDALDELEDLGRPAGLHVPRLEA